MPKKLTRAERYKRNYRLIQNAYHNSTLSKRAQTWGAEKIYNELGIKVDSKKTPQLKKIAPKRQSYYDRKLDKYIYARSIGLKPKESKKLVSYKKAKIDAAGEYYDAKSKKFNAQNKSRRVKLWKIWSERNINEKGEFDRTISNMPPEIEKIARKYNRQTEVAKKQLDDYAPYGYIVAFYMFVENKSFEEIKDLVNPDPHDAYKVHYKIEVRAV